MEYNKLIAEMSLSDEVEGFYVLKAAYARKRTIGITTNAGNVRTI